MSEAQAPCVMHNSPKTAASELKTSVATTSPTSEVMCTTGTGVDNPESLVSGRSFMTPSFFSLQQGVPKRTAQPPSIALQPPSVILQPPSLPSNRRRPPLNRRQ